MLRVSLLGLALLVWSAANAGVLTVTNANNSGTGSLREALNAANLSAGPDTIVFDPSMAGKIITPTIHFPVIHSDGTVIRGDINGDGLPDVGLNGAKILDTDVSPAGLSVDANDCKIIGLAIGRFPTYGIRAWDVSGLEIRACHVSAQLDGATTWINRWGGISLEQCTDCRIGLPGNSNRNIIAAGTSGEVLVAVNLLDCQQVTVSNNYIGVTRAGNRVFAGSGLTGVWLGKLQTGSESNTIGGTALGTGNVIAGLRNGVLVDASPNNLIAGNRIGLNAVGNGSLPIEQQGIALFAGSHHTTIGSPLRGGRNYFAGSPIAIAVSGPDNHHDVIQSNWFGLNTAGTGVLSQGDGVLIANGATDITVGGGGNLVGNRFVVTDKSDGSAYGVVITDGAGDDSVVRYNKFGYYANNKPAPGSDVALLATSAQRLAFLDNIIAQHDAGVRGFGTASIHIYRNRFVSCQYAVQLWDNALGMLGQLDDADTTNDGGNKFRASCVWTVFNHTPNDVRAEGNDWYYTSRLEISAHIYDGHEDGLSGEVDFDPIVGGVHPTGAGGFAAVSAAAMPTGRGAEIAVQASTAGALSVEVVNMAGRRIAGPASDQPCAAGTNRVLWNGRSLTGTKVPSGHYLVRVTLRAADGTQASGLCGLSLR